MKRVMLCLFSLSLLAGLSSAQQGPLSFSKSNDLKIVSTNVTYDRSLEHLIFEINVKGKAGATLPDPAGKMDGAPVLAYVFPTTLKTDDVGFNITEGIVALALTSHPDFDDTPLWDENWDRVYDNDGKVWHSHWVMLNEDRRVAGGLAVKEFVQDDPNVILPPTNPGMPMFMDSPGFHVVTKGNSIKVVVPAYRIRHKTSFNYDAVTSYMEVNTSDSTRPLLGVYEVFSVASGDLSLPYSVKH